MYCFVSFIEPVPQTNKNVAEPVPQHKCKRFNSTCQRFLAILIRKL
ncbi:hypothetical protein L479_01815 [Exiguobacterium sp. S17]|nr:hypothetical protein L479_01815 [Exiguobacterium sp. S17]